MSGLRVNLFGTPRLEHDEAPVPLGRSKALALLAYLCRADSPPTRDALIDLLWPTFDPDDARNNLRRELSILKRTLPPGTILSDRHVAGIEPAAFSRNLIAVDVNEFEDLIEHVREHSHDGAQLCAKCGSGLESAVALYTGDFLAGFTLPDSSAFDEWQFHEADRLRRALGSALQSLADWLESTGEHERALDYAHRHALLDPLDESTQRKLMRLYYVAGQQSAALRHYEITRVTLSKELGIEPEAETVDLYEAIRERRLAVNRETAQIDELKPLPTTNLPSDTTVFIGRKRELENLDRLISDPNVRLITIVGVGGMGKTRLGNAAARRAIHQKNGSVFQDGVFFTPLSPLTRANEIPPALSLSLGFTPGGEGSSARQLIFYLKPRRMLLFVDNIEHLLDEESITFIGDILREAPNIKLLVTSRVRIGLGSEHVFPLDGLGIDEEPDTSNRETPEKEDAVALYIEAARRVLPSYRPNIEELATIRRICRLVGGMPLAIELAAGWSELLTPGAILQEIERSLDFLESSYVDAPARQASLKAVFDSSWRLLNEEEQGALRCLSVFPGTFGIEAASVIAGASIRLLQILANKSWVQSVGNNRFQIHPLLRQYASQERAYFSSMEKELRDRHTLFFANMLAELDEDMRSNHPAAAFDSVAADLDNIRAAIMWMVGNYDLELFFDRMAIPLFRYLESRYQYFLFEPLFIEAAARAEARGNTLHHCILILIQAAFFFNGYPTRFMDYHWVGNFWTTMMQFVWDEFSNGTPVKDFWEILMAWQYGRFVDVQPAIERLRQILANLEKSNNRWEEAFARQSLGRLMSRRPWDTVQYGQEAEAQEILLSALKLFEDLSDGREAAITRLFMGMERLSVGDLEQAKRVLIEAQTRLRTLGETIIAANINWLLGDVYMRLGDTMQSLNYFHEMADILIQSGRMQLATAGLSRESYEAVRYGDLDYALNIRKQCLKLSQQIGDHFTESWDHWELGEIYRVMGQLDEARKWYESSRILFKDTYPESGESFYYRALGDLAQAHGDAELAETHFQSALQWAEDTAHLWQVAYALGGLATASAALGKTGNARQYFLQALRTGWNTGDPGIVLAILGKISLFYEKSFNDSDRAQELAQTVLSHSLSWRETRTSLVELLGLTPEKALDRSTARPFDLASIVERAVSEIEDD